MAVDYLCIFTHRTMFACPGTVLRIRLYSTKWGVWLMNSLLLTAPSSITYSPFGHLSSKKAIRTWPAFIFVFWITVHGRAGDTRKRLFLSRVLYFCHHSVVCRIWVGASQTADLYQARRFHVTAVVVLLLLLHKLVSLRDIPAYILISRSLF